MIRLVWKTEMRSVLAVRAKPGPKGKEAYAMEEAAVKHKIQTAVSEEGHALLASAFILTWCDGGAGLFSSRAAPAVLHHSQPSQHVVW